jgi:exopolysaccharide biosynthesis polyprenyl glycosylphosphotransferase
MNGAGAALRNNWRTIAAALSVATDVLVVTAAYLLARSSVAAPSSPPVLIVALVVFIGAFTAGGIYRTVASVSLRRQFVIAIRACFQGVGIFLFALFLFHPGSFERNLPILVLLWFPAVYVPVWTGVRFLGDRFAYLRFARWKTLVLGVDPELERVLQRVRALPELGYEVVRVVHGTGGPGGHVVFDPAPIERAIREEGVEVVLLSSSQVNGSLERLQEVCLESRVGIRILSRESDELFLRARIFDVAGIPLAWPEPGALERIKGLAKRGFDVLAGVLLLVLLSPVFLLIAIASMLESPGPVIFRQKRALSGEEAPFEFYKFRSMRHRADATKESLAERNESDGPLFKIRDDPRRTRIGRFIRRHSLDELPQLFNVVKGDMSLVGPRPLPVEDFARLTGQDHLDPLLRQRVRARPGMTGLWQISGRSDLGFRDMVLLDLYYVQHQNILFDLEILLRTVPVVLFGRGAY